jgi:hypothetical protein
VVGAAAGALVGAAAGAAVGVAAVGLHAARKASVMISEKRRCGADIRAPR